MLRNSGFRRSEIPEMVRSRAVAYGFRMKATGNCGGLGLRVPGTSGAGLWDFRFWGSSPWAATGLDLRVYPSSASPSLCVVGF